MIEIPLYVILFLFFIFLAIFAGFYIMIMYHIIASASFTFGSFIVSFLIFTLTMLTLYAVTELLSGVDWREPFFSFDTRGIRGLFGY